MDPNTPETNIINATINPSHKNVVDDALWLFAASADWLSSKLLPMLSLSPDWLPEGGVEKGSPIDKVGRNSGWG